MNDVVEILEPGVPPPAAGKPNAVAPADHTADAVAPGGRPRPPNASRATWGGAMALLAAVLLLRLAYLVWMCPYELAGDEAYYWEQARHLDLSYNEKGPALAWMIAACTAAFGDVEWAVRLPMWLSFGVAAWGVGRLALSVSRGDGRVGFFAVASFLLVPAFLANGQICTQDGPLTALWVALTAGALRLFRRWRAGENTWGDWLLLWGMLGAGCLLKQSVLLFLPSLGIYWLIERRALPLRRVFVLQQLAGIALFTLLISPMVVWNHRHGWPMLSHTVGHLGAGGDQAGRVNKGNPLVWVSSLVGGVVGSLGPPAILLMAWASRRTVRERGDDRGRWGDRLWLICAAWPSLAFFAALSFTKPVLPTWPLPSMVPLAALVAELAVARFGAAGSASPLAPAARDFRRAWGAMVVYGLAGAFLLSFPNALGRLPVGGAFFQRTVLKRVQGHRADAAELRHALDSVQTPDGRPPHVVAHHYQVASLLAFYLPGHPPVSAGGYPGHRRSSFDEWADTRLDNPALHGRCLLLEGKGDTKWDRALSFDRLDTIVEDKFYLAVNYRGLRPESGRNRDGDE